MLVAGRTYTPITKNCHSEPSAKNLRALIFGTKAQLYITILSELIYSEKCGTSMIIVGLRRNER